MIIRQACLAALLALAFTAPAKAQTYDPIPWQEISRNDPLVDRYYPEIAALGDAEFGRPPRIHVARIDHPIGPLTFTMWVGTEFCGINNCIIKIFDSAGMQLGGANTCDVAEFNTIDPSHQFVRLCSNMARPVTDMLWNYDPPAARDTLAFWQSSDPIHADHNGSLMAISPAEGTIRYARVREGLRGTIADGTILFRGEPWEPGGPFSGTAYTFRRGCEPAPYAVTASYQGFTEILTLKGEAPVRAASGCQVTAYSAESGNAVLQFHTTFD